MRTYPNVSTDNVINSQSPVALKQANGQTFEGWAIYFPTQDLVDQFLVTDEEPVRQCLGMKLPNIK